MVTKISAARQMACHCGWCGVVRRSDGTWDDGDDTAPSGPVTHGICPDCAVAFRAGIEDSPRPWPRPATAYEPRAGSESLMAGF
jgi:hypothetical protein